jgi:hypothetical protein
VLSPFLASLTGIWFWLQVSSLLSRIGENKVVYAIGSSTKDIMIHHQFAFWLVSSVFYLARADGFNVQQYMTNQFYFYTPDGLGQFVLIYSAVGVGLPILARKVYEKTKKTLLTIQI